jgi:lysophospholipase
MLPDRLKGHAEGVQPFLDDYQALLAAFETRLPKPWIAMGHSMGGCLTALALGQGERRFSAAILSAPMFGLNTGGRPKAVTRLLAQAMVMMGKGGDYVLGDPGKPFGSDFANNALTHDQSRFDRAFSQITACPDLMLGSPTWSWLKFAFQACDGLAKNAAVTQITIPVIVLGAGAEALVDNTEQAAVTARMPKGRHLTVDGAFHEILMETDALRDPFWQAFDALAAEVAS